MILAILQARFSSTRLPGKVMKNLAGAPMLIQQVRRVQRSKRIDKLVVATSNDSSDTQILDLCAAHQVDAFAGDLNDVLDRFYQAALQYPDIDTVVRLTGDCPVIDPEIIDEVIDLYLNNDFDYATNALNPVFPDGLDVEVFSLDALKEAWQNAELPSQREHVTPYINRQPELFKIGHLGAAENWSHLRWTVDEPEDFELIDIIYQALYANNPAFTYAETLAYVKANPHLMTYNTMYERNEGYAKSLAAERGLMTDNNFQNGTGQKLYEHAKSLIPGGTQLLSKRPEMMLPDLWPSYYSKVEGVTVWDLDGNAYIDMAHNGIGTCILGAKDPDVDAAVLEAFQNGVMSTLNCPEEVELAELLCELHPWADMVRYARTGGEAMAISVRIARAATGKDKVLFCGYHGWHNWYLSTNLADDAGLDGHLIPGLAPKGVPRGLVGTTFPFEFNNIENLRDLVSTHAGEVAAIVMEPIRTVQPEPGYLAAVRAIADEIGAVLVFDECTAAFRQNAGGAHLLYDVNPDIAMFAKAVSNGYAMAAIIGTEGVMSAAQETFISSSYWTERIGPAAAIATIRKYQAANVAEKLNALGHQVQEGWRAAAETVGIAVHVDGLPALSHFGFDHPQANALRTLFTQYMLSEGYLATGGVYFTNAHSAEIVAEYLVSVEKVFRILKDHIETDTIQDALIGPEAHSRFKRLVS